MDASDSDHSISGNISIPHWMKSRVHDRYDTAELAALSPPNQDDSFFYIPYNKFNHHEKSSDSPSVILANQNPPLASLASSSEGSSSLLHKHTEPCLKYLVTTTKMDSKEPTALADYDQKLPKLLKSLGTDDGFKGEAAQCGHSVVQVAQQMIAERFVGRPYKLNTSDETAPVTSKQRVRRGSKSLPASPVATPDSTPQIQRKNRFFTGAFVENPTGSWLVAGLLGAHREQLSASQMDLLSDDNNNASSGDEKMQVADSLRRNNSSVLLRSMDSSQSDAASPGTPSPSLHHAKSAANLTKSVGSGGDTSPGPGTPPVKPRPKPSELREMNFWSPTSM